MHLEGLRWSRDSGSTLCDTPQNGRSRTGWGGSLLDEILQRIDEGNGLPEKTLKIETQSHIDDTDIHSIPDGLISCNYAFNIYIESKLSDVINLTQLENHKKLIVEDRDERNKLIYITTHDKRPEILPQEIIWTNWTLSLIHI